MELSHAGTYRREVAASLARVWENVFDWEHLPSLHEASFHSVGLLEHGDWGWRVRLLNQPGDPAKAQVLELRADRPAGVYVAATLSGPGAGTEIRTSLTRLAEHRTGVAVEFHVPEDRPERLAAIGARYGEVYARLWDEDEAMMVHRERALAARRRPIDAGPLSLGPFDAVRAALPMPVEFGAARFRLVELDGDLIAHAADCPHWLGPLDEAVVEDGCIRCPWHGYRFDVRTGASADGRGLRLTAAPRVVLRDGAVFLEPIA
ncbi:nitrite reductase/ring-hydroxylating ferredoxin subunit [Caulobacter ginsengisoli]|uniref:Nitrite reductase/ring-hydroxylating ferredoxin subunit n=1 Tax=Caulobacter ginsengisoli TaxID=400775 RepID=A0ABU0IQL3_9CAUL|nr:Rieske 2Fe-2S domain-containing protein [Caulobacter ginsengisoli]MDQ0464307.1 nitrite reductase/ring-hydroxylating ferredoxin subunit [Caulobacter ginsengisoli]